MNLRKRMVCAALAAAGIAVGPLAGAQTTVVSETWSGATGPFPVVVNPGGNSLNLGDPLNGDESWAISGATGGLGAAAHSAISLVDAGGGDIELLWNADSADGEDEDILYATTFTPVSIDNIESVEFSAEVTLNDIAAGGDHSATFYLGTSNFANYYSWQVNYENDIGEEVLEIEWAFGSGDNDVKFGDMPTAVGAGFANGVHTLSGSVTISGGTTTIDIELVDAGNNVIASGSTVVPAGEVIPGGTNIDTFFMEGARRTYAAYDDISVTITEGSGGPGPGPGGPIPQVPAGAPVDGGLGLAILNGIAALGGAAVIRRTRK